MPAPRTRPTAVPPTADGLNFGSLDFYSGGFTLPKGRYALEFNVIMRSMTRADGSQVGKPRLGVMINAHPLDGGDPHEQFMSMGSKADISFAPNPAGKGVVSIPGAPATTAPRNTNWNIFLKSLYDCGLPKGIFQNDISVLDGIWVQTDLIPEPEERKSYGSTETGEAQSEARAPGLIPVVSEIIDGGKPWEGGGGFSSPAPAAAPSKPAAKVAPGRPVAVAAPAPASSDVDNEDVTTAAISGISAVLEAEPNGTSKLKLRMGAFKSVTASAGAEMAQAVIDTCFTSDEVLNGLLGQLGYTVVGTMIKPA